MFLCKCCLLCDDRPADFYVCVYVCLCVWVSDIQMDRGRCRGASWERGPRSLSPPSLICTLWLTVLFLVTLETVSCSISSFQFAEPDCQSNPQPMAPPPETCNQPQCSIYLFLFIRSLSSCTLLHCYHGNRLGRYTVYKYSQCKPKLPWWQKSKSIRTTWSKSLGWTVE